MDFIDTQKTMMNALYNYIAWIPEQNGNSESTCLQTQEP